MNKYICDLKVSTLNYYGIYSLACQSLWLTFWPWKTLSHAHWLFYEIISPTSSELLWTIGVSSECSHGFLTLKSVIFYNIKKLCVNLWHCDVFHMEQEWIFMNFIWHLRPVIEGYHPGTMSEHSLRVIISSRSCEIWIKPCYIDITWASGNVKLLVNHLYVQKIGMTNNKETSKPHIINPLIWVGNILMTSGFPSQRANDSYIVAMSWHHLAPWWPPTNWAQSLWCNIVKLFNFLIIICSWVIFNRTEQPCTK